MRATFERLFYDVITHKDTKKSFPCFYATVDFMGKAQLFSLYLPTVPTVLY